MGSVDEFGVVSFVVGEKGGDGFLELVDYFYVLYGGGYLVELLVVHLTHYVAQVLPAAGFG